MSCKLDDFIMMVNDFWVSHSYISKNWGKIVQLESKQAEFCSSVQNDETRPVSLWSLGKFVHLVVCFLTPSSDFHSGMSGKLQGEGLGENFLKWNQNLYNAFWFVFSYSNTQTYPEVLQQEQNQAHLRHDASIIFISSTERCSTSTVNLISKVFLHVFTSSSLLVASFEFTLELG